MVHFTKIDGNQIMNPQHPAVLNLGKRIHTVQSPNYFFSIETHIFPSSLYGTVRMKLVSFSPTYLTFSDVDADVDKGKMASKGGEKTSLTFFF